MDLPECGAMSQGYIGYHLQQGIGREMHKRYKRWHAATVVTQIECDPDDPAFANPTKPIGPFYTEEQAKEIMAENPDMTFVEDSGRGWRRVVASPEPKKIVEADSILNLLDNEFIVIACGGGGIPVVRDYENKGCYKGVAAVIDKDMGGELLAEDCSADVLFLLTAVEHVAINFGKPNQEELEELTADEAERLADEGQFGKGSMEPKVRAAIKFARSRKGPHLHHRCPRQGRRDHGRSFRHPHHGLIDVNGFSGTALWRLAVGRYTLDVPTHAIRESFAPAPICGTWETRRPGSSIIGPGTTRLPLLRTLRNRPGGPFFTGGGHIRLWVWGALRNSAGAFLAGCRPLRPM